MLEDIPGQNNIVRIVRHWKLVFFRAGVGQLGICHDVQRIPPGGFVRNESPIRGRKGVRAYFENNGFLFEELETVVLKKQLAISMHGVWQ